MNLSHFDLNLLTVFNQLYQDRQVSLAADHLGLSQPAVSGALRRLRRLLDDELFVRTPRGMQPTPLADHLAGPVANALALIHESMLQPPSFDPRHSRRHFTFAMTDIGEIHFMPRLMAAMRADAPGLSFSVVRSVAVSLKAELESGAIDFAFGYLPELQADIHRRALFTLDYVCLFREGHPIASANDPRRAFIDAEHVLTRSIEAGMGRAEEAIRQAGIQRNIRLTVPHIVALADILEPSDLLATVPEPFAQRSARHFKLAFMPHPIPLPKIEAGLFWHARYHRDPASQWLRQRIAALFQEEGMRERLG
ncbi:MAG: LysR family transcriptional regulator [Pigmentiphaga sp.]